MKIVFINTLYYPKEIGGAEHSMRLVAEQHAAAGGEAVVLTLSDQKRLSTRMVNGVKVYDVPLANIGFLHAAEQMSALKRKAWHIIDTYNPFMARRIRKILAAERPDIVETNNLQGFSVSAWKVAQDLSIPVVQVIRDYYLGCANSSMFRGDRNCDGQCLRCKVFSAPKKHFSTIPDSVISVSQRSYDLLAKFGLFPDQQNIHVRPSGIEPVDELSMTNLRRGGEVLRIGFLGRLTEIKGVQLLLDAVSAMPDGTVEFFIAGADNSDYAQSLKRAYSRPNIHFMGRTFPATLFGKIHCLFVPSLWEEPFGKVIAEAIAAGVPVAVSAMGGMPENVEEGVTGYVFQPDVESIVALLKRLHASDFPTAAQVSACQAAADHYSQREVYLKHREVWEQTLANSKAAKTKTAGSGRQRA